MLLTVDCGAVPAPIRDEVLRRVQAKAPLKPERFMLCNSHNHSGPNLKGMGSITGAEREHLAQYAKELTGRLEAGRARRRWRRASRAGWLGRRAPWASPPTAAC